MEYGDLIESARFYCYKDVKNALQEGSRVAIINLEFVVDLDHIKFAVSKALLNERRGKMKTKDISNEIIYQLASTTKISESVKQFSIESKNCSEICVVTLDENLLNIADKIDGESIAPALLATEDFLSEAKKEKIRQFFKLTKEEVEVSGLSDAVINRIATKDN